MRLSVQELPVAAIQTGRSLLPHGEGNCPVIKFGAVARALWPRKTAAHLAAKARVSERQAKNWLAGEHEPSARAVQAIVNEILS